MWFFRRLSIRKLLLQINERTITMSKEIDDLNAATAEIKTAASDASRALQDLAAKLVAQSSTNPADIETAAAQLTAIAKGLEAVVVAVGEPVTGNDTVSAPAPVPPASAVAEGASPNPPGSTTAGDIAASGGETAQGGGAGVDTLIGGQGADTLTGGAA